MSLLVTGRVARFRPDLTTEEEIHLFREPGRLQPGEFAQSVHGNVYHRCANGTCLLPISPRAHRTIVVQDSRGIWVTAIPSIVCTGCGAHEIVWHGHITEGHFG